MQLRRALIAFVLVFVGVAAIASVSAPEEGGDAPATSGPRPRALAPDAVTVALRHPVEGPPPVRTVRGGAHVLLRVQAGAAGNVEIPGLGLIEPVAPGTPAVFDLLATRPGRYDVSLSSVAAERSKVGTLVVEE